MAMIKNVNLTNFKGTTVKQELTGFDVFRGQNGIGKTSRLQALYLAMLGYIPNEPKKDEDNFYKFSSSKNRMAVGIEGDNYSFERAYERTIKQKRNGEQEIKIKKDIDISPSQGEKTLTDKENRIVEWVGRFPVMLNFDEFLALSDAKKREFIYNLVQFDAKKWNRDTVAMYLDEKVLTEELKENSEAHFEAMMTVLEEVLDEFKGEDPQEAITSMLEFSRKKTSEWDATRKESKGASVKIAEMKNELKEVVRNLGINKESLEDFRTKRIEAEKELTAEIQKVKGREERQKQVEKLEAELKLLQEKDYTGSIKIEHEELEKKKQELEKLEEELKQFDLKFEELDKEKEELKPRYEEVKKIEKEIEGLKAERNSLIGEYKANQNLIEQLEEASKNKKCVIDCKIPCNQDFTDFIKRFKENIFEISKNGEGSKEKIETKQKELEDLKNKTYDTAVLIDQKRDVLSQQGKENLKAQGIVKTEIEKISNKIDSLEKESSNKEKSISELQGKIEEFKVIPEHLQGDLDIEVIEKQIEGLKTNISELQIKIEEQEKTKTTLQNLQRTLVDYNQANIVYMCFKDITEAIGAKGLQGKIMKESLEPLKTAIDENLKLMGIPHDFYISTTTERGKDVFQFGWTVSKELEIMDEIEAFEAEVDEKNAHRNFDSLSDGEKMMLLIAVLVAFMEKENPAIKVLAIDNAQDLDKKNLSNVVEGLKKIKHKLDNVIIAGVIDLPQSEEYTIWDLDCPQA